MSPTTHHRPSLARRIGLACALVAALLLCPLPASGGIAWDVGIAVGYAALVVAVTLYLYPLRGEGLPHKRLFTLSQHRRIGWIALVLGLLHAAILLVAQPLVGHYLLPSAPLYMLLGLIALIALAVLVATGLAARSALRSASTRRTKTSEPHTHKTQDKTPGKASDKTPGAPSPTPSPARATPPSVSTHAILAALLLALTAAHILGSHQLANKPAKIITVCALLLLPLLWAALRVTPAPPVPRRQLPATQRGAAPRASLRPHEAPPPTPTNPTPQLRRSRDPIPTPHPNRHLAPATARSNPVTPPGVLPPREAHYRRLRNLPSQLHRQNRRRQLPRMPSLFPTQPHPVSGSHVPHVLPNLPHRSGSNDRQTRPYPRLLHVPRQLFNSSLTARSACSMATSV